MSVLPDCRFCGKPVNPAETGVFRLVKGWVEQRRAGGANALHDEESLEAWAHGFCFKHLKTQQGALL